MRTRSYDCLTVVLAIMLYAVHAWVGATPARYDFVYTRMYKQTLTYVIFQSSVYLWVVVVVYRRCG